MNQVAFLASDKTIPAHFGFSSSRAQVPRSGTCAKQLARNAHPNAPAVVYLIDLDPELSNSLTMIRGLGFETRSYPDLRTLGDANLADRPGCVLLNAKPSQLDRFPDPLWSIGVRLPIIVMAELPDVRMAVLAMKLGAVDFLERSVPPRDLSQALEFAIGLDRERRRNDAYCVEICLRFETLTNRERQVLALVTQGLLNKQVAYELGISEITVKAHRGSVMRKMEARTFVGLVRMADLIEERLGGRNQNPQSL